MAPSESGDLERIRIALEELLAIVRALTAGMAIEVEVERKRK
jgi:hypothetical protein